MFNDLEVVWVDERSMFIAYCNRFPGVYAKDRWSATRARQQMEDRIRNLLVCNSV
ncbi:hypothetical protein [Nocardia aurantiaca]|uniref:Uncharacterized protein n=1 Tax=Nocardia aurantiaca TaxID=2675850 RepID=A0A6I3L375_9NOCA|nr:hypothetical protein [Nocardia aurantiaca]MTE16061.1 hypothetical protein [Nocardia aurantiaca]